MQRRLPWLAQGSLTGIEAVKEAAVEPLPLLRIVGRFPMVHHVGGAVLRRQREAEAEAQPRGLG